MLYNMLYKQYNLAPGQNPKVTALKEEMWSIPSPN